MGHNLKIGAFDLENSPMLSWHWGRWDQRIPPVQTVQESRVLCFGWKWLNHPEKRHHGKYTFKAEYEHGRDDMLFTIRELLTEADGVVSWNGAKFDSHKIRTEFILEEMNPPAPYKEIDLMRVARNQFAFSSNKLDHVAKQLGVGQKVIHEGFELWPKVMNGDEAARRVFKKYQRQDVELLGELYEKFLPWIPASMHPNVGMGNPDPSCPYCGSERLQSRGFNASAAGSYRRYQCQSCGKWSSDRTRVASSVTRAL